MSTHTQEYRKGQGQGARAGGQCAKDSARARGKKNRPHHRRCSCSAAEGHDFSLADSAQLAQKKKKKAGSELGRGFEVKSPIGRRSSRDRSDRVKPRSLIVLRPPCAQPPGPGVKEKEKGRFGVGAELRGQILDRPPIRRGSVGPSKAPLAYRPTSSLPNPPGQVSAFKEPNSPSPL